MSTNVLSIKPEDWTIEEDVKNTSGLAYTDGCGFITANMYQKINDFYTEGGQKVRHFQVN